MFLCTASTSKEALNNVCKALITAGYWLVFLDLDALAGKRMSQLAKILSQIVERQEKILVDNEQFDLVKVRHSDDMHGPCFASLTSLDSRLADDYREPASPATGTSASSASSSSLSSSQLSGDMDRSVAALSKDLLERFQLVRVIDPPSDHLYDLININLTINGFSNSADISQQLATLVNEYDTLLCNKKTGLFAPTQYEINRYNYLFRINLYKI